MSEIKNTFLKSKMNKDLDSRLIPNGEYRDAKNVNISRSEDSDVGAVENVSGNILAKDWLGSLNCPGIDVIGHASDLANDRIFFFLTNYTDNSIDNLSNFAPDEAFEPSVGGRKLYDGACCWIAYYNVVSQQGEIIVSGNFLNFSKTHPIKADVLEDLLFFTDDRNQPRKINVNTAISNPETYYTNEDHISVTKLAPMDAPNLYYQNGAGDYVSSMINKTEEYLPVSALTMIKSNSENGDNEVFLTEDINSYITYPPITPNTRGINLMKPDLGYFDIVGAGTGFDEIQIEYPIGSGANASDSIINYIAAALEAGYKSQVTASPSGVGQGFTIGDVIGFQLQNPDYDATWTGDKKFIEDKFLRFSYRFKYDDGEYSVMAPFTQPAFIPKQWGHLINGYNWLYGGDGEADSGTFEQRWALWKRNIWNGDEDDIGKSGIVSFMENQVNEINLNIPMPYTYSNGNNRIFSKQLGDRLKIESIEILSKESNGLAIKVVDTIPISQLNAITAIEDFYNYNYKSIKPIRVLPTNQSTRVYDKSPVKAKTQAITGNRIVYGNYIDKQTPPDSLNYEVKIVPKPNIPSSTQLPQTRLEYPNHTLKQNRTYQVGIVLSDRYGRSSSVILRDKSLDVDDPTFFTDTIYHGYNGGGLDTLDWPGDSLQVQFNDIIPNSISTKPDYPGLYSTSNPTGWYSYKIVVKQTEQEYYNVYLAGATSGDIIWTGTTGVEYISIPTASTPKISAEPTFLKNGVVSNISLYNDNINKVPKALIDVGATDTIYGSNTLLYPRVITENLLPSLYLPPQSIGAGSAVNLPISIQAPSGLFESEVTSIRPFRDLGDWTTKKGVTGNASLDPDDALYGERWYPNNEGGNEGVVFIDPFYKADDNPFIATITTDFTIGAGKALQERYPTNFFSNQLTVFETNPVKSNLDIFWETSTSGLISDLNSEVALGFPSGAPDGVSDIGFEFFENDSANTRITAKFEPVDDNNNACVDPAQSISNFNVINANGVNVTSTFEIKQDFSGTSGTPAFWIENTKPVPYLYNSTSRRWTFSFDVTANLTTTSVTFKGSLSNIEPSFTYNPIQWVGMQPTLNGATSSAIIPFSTYSLAGQIDYSNECIAEISFNSFENGSLNDPYSEIYVKLAEIYSDGVLVDSTTWPVAARPIVYAPGTFFGSTNLANNTPVQTSSWVLAFPNNFNNQYNSVNNPGITNLITTDLQFTLSITDCNNNLPNFVGGLTKTIQSQASLPIWGILL